MLVDSLSQKRLGTGVVITLAAGCLKNGQLEISLAVWGNRLRLCKISFEGLNFLLLVRDFCEYKRWSFRVFSFIYKVNERLHFQKLRSLSDSQVCFFTSMTLRVVFLKIKTLIDKIVL
jgi:hypothetical protein